MAYSDYNYGDQPPFFQLFFFADSGNLAFTTTLDRTSNLMPLLPYSLILTNAAEIHYIHYNEISNNIFELIESYIYLLLLVSLSLYGCYFHQFDCASQHGRF